MKKWVLVALATIVAFAAASNVNACWGNGCAGGYDDYNYYYGNGVYGYNNYDYGVYAAPGYYYVPPHYGYADYYPYWGYNNYYGGYAGGYAYSYSYSYSYGYGNGYGAPIYRQRSMQEQACAYGWC